MKTLVVAIGNPMRRDDGLAHDVVSKLSAEQCDVIKCRGESDDLSALWEGRDSVIVVDAIRSGAPAGTFHSFQAEDKIVPIQIFGRTTHSFSLAESVEMARVLGNLPKSLWLCGIEGQDFSLGEGLSKSVTEAVPQAVNWIKNKCGTKESKNARSKHDGELDAKN